MLRWTKEHFNSSVVSSLNMHEGVCSVNRAVVCSTGTWSLVSSESSLVKSDQPMDRIVGYMMGSRLAVGKSLSDSQPMSACSLNWVVPDVSSSKHVDVQNRIDNNTQKNDAFAFFEYLPIALSWHNIERLHIFIRIAKYTQLQLHQVFQPYWLQPKLTKHQTIIVRELAGNHSY